MASALARNGGEKQALLSAIRQRMATDKEAELRPAEAVMVLEWAIDCEDKDHQSELLTLFASMGGLKLIRRVLLPDD